MRKQIFAYQITEEESAHLVIFFEGEFYSSFTFDKKLIEHLNMPKDTIENINAQIKAIRRVVDNYYIKYSEISYELNSGGFPLFYIAD
jgi:hypothetical protein